METIVLILIGVVGLTLGYVLGNHEARRKAIDFVNTEQSARKQNRKKMIMAEIDEKGKITNDDVQDLFGVSHSTATRYFDELQEDGLVEEVGEGRGTYYERV
ncbi:MAG: winged helix-turn-helix transcriptional regulator [Candidatus Pacebacteria bacterium]|nr:winged helix-turn-helix transcriptional regulator [Candidatus Paceibacterota bacterium]MDP6659671.1 winged helix-turn-helix transcriptional regulator [Candidatus Paceibacterota bacterium]